MKKLLFICLSLLALSSCATLISGTKQTLHFDSKPAGALVEVNGLDVGTTPCDVAVSSSLSHKSFSFYLEGYQTKTIVPQRTLNPISILDWFTILGLVVDVGTGALMKYDTANYTVTLIPDKKESGFGVSRKYFWYK